MILYARKHVDELNSRKPVRVRELNDLRKNFEATLS